MAPRGPPSKPEQLDYLVQWFAEYSEVQKDDFLLTLIEKFSQHNDEVNDENALPDSLKELNMSDHPPSIFQCRMKLFNDWFANWSDEEKTELLSRLNTLDEKFMERFHNGSETTSRDEQSDVGEDIDHSQQNNHEIRPEIQQVL